jgi:hypothetical protein
MDPRTEDLRSKYLPLLAIFLAGLLIGWLLIGWNLWPVQYTNALPVDLRADKRDQYLLMTAESYAANLNLDLAQQRLEFWTQSQLAKDLGNLQERLQTNNPAQASQVQQLVVALKVVTQPGVAPASGGAVPAVPAVTPASATAAPATSSFGQTLQRACLGALYVLLVLLGILLVAVLWRRWRTAQDRRQGMGIDAVPAMVPPEPVERWSVSGVADEAKSTWPDADLDEPAGSQPAARPGWGSLAPGTDATRQRDDLPSPASSTPAAQPLPAPVGQGTAAPKGASVESGWRPGASAAPKPVANGTPVKIGEFLAAYHMGEPDYDEAFDIHDSAGQYVGQCGLGLTTPVGRANDQAAALQVWLWDTNDPDTKVQVLMSEGAYRDTALRDQLAGEHTATPVRARSEFQLETYNLLLSGVIENVEYADQEPSNGIFAELVVRLRAYKET